MKLNTILMGTSLVALLVFAGCDNKAETKLAPTASALAAPKPKAASAQAFAVDKASSKVDFMMDAPKEKIRGRVHGTTEGSVNVLLTDLTKTTADLKVDIGGIELYKTNIGDDGKPDGEEAKDELQNKHARAWLEIGEDAPEKARKENSRVQFVIKEVTTDTKDVTKLKGAERKVKLTVKGTFLLHGRKSDKTAELEVTFKYAGDKAESMTVKTVKPFAIGLAEHDVHPRESFGKLAQKTLEVLAPKVAKEANVSIDFSAKLAGAQ